MEVKDEICIFTAKNTKKVRVTFCSGLLYVFFAFALSSHCVYAQQQGKDYLRLMFYNVENYFDTEDDPTTNDNEFTPEGSMRWTQSRYIEKRNNIFRVIANVGEWDPPALVGLCEVENRAVLDDLVKNTPLAKYPYRIIHKDSPDLRGIDVALLYRGDYLKCVGQQFIRVRFSDNRKRTRDILYATLCTAHGDTLHVFVNHWPSRVGGQKQSEPARMLAASLVRQKVDSIFNRNAMAKIVVTGDFNDNPQDKSLLSELRALNDTAKAKPSALFNLSAYRMKESTGTIKYQGKWSVFDQIVVSGGLLKGMPRTDANRCQIFRADYLFEPDERYQGVKPFRTYIGMRYNRGFSDHLPVYVDIVINGNSN
jgi:endonuclease/exonuclease/phosphatase family metal-dependent hydrolase